MNIVEEECSIISYFHQIAKNSKNVLINISNGERKFAKISQNLTRED